MGFRGAREGSMKTAGRGEVWTGPQLAARLVASNGVAPEPVQHVIFRSTRQPDGKQLEGYEVPGEKRRLNNAALDFWLARHGLAGSDRLAVAILVIRETLDERGLIRQCTLERRRGLADGPYCGDPARVDFAGPAGAVRLYRSHLDGRLVEIAPSAETAPPRVRLPEQFAGEHKALQARFGEEVRILDAREPTLFEDMIGLSNIVHVRAENGREVDCGIGWHGSAVFILEADFPRFGTQLALLPEDAAAVDAALRANGLVRGETRLDEQGVAVLARRRGGEELFRLRPRSGQVRLGPYTPGRGAAGPDQQRWMRYAETYEGLAVLDAYRDGESDDVIVLTGDLSGQVWRHHIDVDGVETWRKADEEAAVGALHREHLFPGSLAAADAGQPDGAEGSPGPLPQPRSARATADDSLLARAEGYVRAMAALREAREAADGVPDAPIAHIRELQAALLTLEAHVAAVAAQDMLERLGEGALQPDAFAHELVQIEAMLRHELALVRLVAVAPPRAKFLQRDQPALGAEVAECFPSASYDIEEAAVCLAFRRPTASVFHCMKIMERGIRAFARSVDLADPVAAGERDWQQILRLLRGAAEARSGELRDALGAVRRRWRSPVLQPADKYTEEEAELIFQAVSDFMRLLAARCDEHGRRLPVNALG